jgi:hypothetical protein
VAEHSVAQAAAGTKHLTAIANHLVMRQAKAQNRTNLTQQELLLRIRRKLGYVF